MSISNMKKFLIKNIWLIALHLIFAISLIANFPIGKFFIGWDALNPEFNIMLNITRALFPFWQENYGLGTVTGHGFAATLPHTLFIGLLSNFLPDWSLRSIFTFSCHYAGGVGMYFLIRYLLEKITTFKLPHIQQLIPVMSFIASLYYLFNLGTVQVFYIQLEAFITQYAALPWLFLTLFLALDTGKKKYFFAFFGVSVLSSIQGFIPSLFVTYFIAFILALVSFSIAKRSRNALKKAFLLLMLTICANLYWLGPIVYFQITNGNNFLTAYNNLSSTQHFIELSNKYGDLKNIVYLKSYLFDSFQLGTFLLQPWIDHHKNALVAGIGIVTFISILIGIFVSIVKLRSYHTIFFALLFLYAFSGIAINTFPFSFLTDILQSISPTYEQAFRTTFTKFGIATIFAYSVQFAFALFFFTFLVSKIKLKLAPYVFLAITIISILFYALPVFQGHLLYDKLTLTIPSAYQDFTTYINSQSEGRIADFPQNCNDGWYSYNWGYFGSGFMWYGVEHPFMSRSFDVWSSNNENYYWELSQALAQKDFEKIDQILNKYDIKWILYDPNITSCSTAKKTAINTDLIEFLTQNGRFVSEREFGGGLKNPIILLKNNNYALDSYVQSQRNVMHVAPASLRTDSDAQSADYYTGKNRPDKYYPIQSLLTKRGDNSLINNAKITKNEILLEQTIPLGLTNYVFQDTYSQQEDLMPVEISVMVDQNNISRIRLTTNRPSIFLDGKLLTKSDNAMLLGVKEEILPDTSKIFINGQEVSKNNDGAYSSYFLLRADNSVEIVHNEELLFSWTSASSDAYRLLMEPPSSLSLPEYKKGILTIKIPYVVDNTYFGAENTNVSAIIPEPCNEITPSGNNAFEISSDPNSFMRLISQKSSQCLKLYFPKLISNQGHLLSIKTRNVSGNLPKTSVYNNANLLYSDLGTGKKLQNATTTHVLPPSAINDVGYDLSIENASRTDTKSINDIYSIGIYAIPYKYLKSISFNNPEYRNQPLLQVVVNDVNHKNPTRYTVITDKGGQLLTLSQSYDNGWKAYIQNSDSSTGIKNQIHKLFPFHFGQEIKNHVMVNNWANGWILPTSTQNPKITILFLPQYLQYLGFGLLLLPFLWLMASMRKFIFRATTKLNTYFEKQANNLKSIVHHRMNLPIS